MVFNPGFYPRLAEDPEYHYPVPFYGWSKGKLRVTVLIFERWGEFGASHRVQTTAFHTISSGALLLRGVITGQNILIFGVYFFELLL